MKVSFWKHYPILDQKAETLAKATIDFQVEFNLDFVKLTPAGTWQAVSHGAEDHSLPDDNLGRRAVNKPLISKADDWLKLIDFSNEQPELLKEMLEACRLVANSEQIEQAVFPTMFCPISQAIQISGLELFLQHCKMYPDNVRRGITQITKNTKWLIDAFKSNGAEGIYFVTQHMQDALVNPAIYREFGVHSDSECLTGCRDFNHVIFHLHGDHVVPSLGEISENCTIHYADLSAAAVLSATNSNYGIPTSIMRNLKEDREIEAYLTDFIKKYPEIEIIMAECVIPLDFPDMQLKKWIRAAKKIERSA